MAGQYSKATIAAILKQKVADKGFVLQVQKGEGKGIAATTPTLVDLLDGLAEAMEAQLRQGSQSAELVASDFKIGPTGTQQPVATKAQPGQMNVVFDATTDPQFFAWLETLHTLLQASYPEAGYGAPSTFATALKTLISSKPSSLSGRITEGSSKIKVTV